MAFDASQFMSPTDSGYEITNSLRFNDADNAQLVRTQSAGNRRTYSFSVWFKRGKQGGAALSANKDVFLGAINADNMFRIANDHLQIYDYDGSADYGFITTAAVRDSSAWYHAMFVVDTTSSTAAHRQRIYLNGVELTDKATDYGTMAQNYQTLMNSSGAHRIGAGIGDNAGYEHFDGYLAELNFIDGAAKVPADFGETGDYGEWKPIKYAGAYGDEGWYLDFKSSGVGTAGSSTIGADRSGNTNHWTSTNVAVTDQMLDSPTNNFATLNPSGWQWSKKAAKMSEGNLSFGKDGTDWTVATGTQTIPQTKKIYFEVRGIDANAYVGIALANENSNAYDEGSRPDGGWTKGLFSLYIDSNTQAIAYRATTAGTALGAQTFSGSNFNNAVVGVAVDIANSNIKFFINNTEILSQSPGNVINNDKDYVPIVAGSTNLEMAVNFGQDSSFAGAVTAQGNQDANNVGDFFYAPPSGYLALCTASLPEPAVIPSEHFNTVLWAGNDADDRSISGVGFQPDFVWNKARNRSGGDGHYLYDAIRGATKVLYSNAANAEATEGNALQAFESDGFEMGSDSNSNSSSYNYVAWNWKANGVGASNTAGSINTTKTSANVDAGFSIITYSGNNTAGATIGHGLSKAPEMVIIKSRTNASDWWDTYHYDIGANNSLFLNTTNAALDRTYFHDTHPSSTLIYLGNDRSSNGPSETFVAYAFHSVDGYSSVGSYEGNGVADGTFVYTGFRPAFVLTKNADAVDNWSIADTSRSPHNVAGESLRPDTTDSEDSAADIDILSNGFKVRQADSHRINYDAETFIYLAFAETPFKYSNAR